VRAVSIAVLWLAAIAVAVTLWAFGLVQHYWYFNDNEHLGYDLLKWQGDTLDNSFGYPKGYGYRYSFVRFERHAEPRIIGIIIVLATACAGTIFLVSRPRRKA
jgi:hypothetical protein